MKDLRYVSPYPRAFYRLPVEYTNQNEHTCTKTGCFTSSRAYKKWLDNGYEGTEADFLQWLKVKNNEDTVKH